MQEIMTFLKELSVQYYYVPDIIFRVYVAIFVIAIIICNISLFYSFGGRSGAAFTELVFSHGLACGALPAGIYYINDRFLHFNSWIVIILIFMVFPFYSVIETYRIVKNMNHDMSGDGISTTDSSSSGSLIMKLSKSIVQGIESETVDDTEENTENSVKPQDSRINEKTENVEDVSNTVPSLKGNRNKKHKKDVVTPKKRLSKRHKK